MVALSPLTHVCYSLCRRTCLVAAAQTSCFVDRWRKQLSLIRVRVCLTPHAQETSRWHTGDINRSYRALQTLYSGIHTFTHTYVHTYIHTYIQIQLHVPWLNHSALSSCFFNLSQFLCTSHQLISVVNFCWRANHLKHLISSYLQNLCLLNFGFGHLVRAAAVQLPLLGAPLLRQI